MLVLHIQLYYCTIYQMRQCSDLFMAQLTPLILLLLLLLLLLRTLLRHAAAASMSALRHRRYIDALMLTIVAVLR
jgi:hypothetical protein